MQILSGIISLAILVVAILVLIKMFKKEGAMKGILGVICLLYAFYWGWVNHKEQNITNLMWAWTGLIVLNVIVSFMISGQATSGG
jgi:hypothetical protein